MRIRVVPNSSIIFRIYVTDFSTNDSNVARALYVSLSDSFSRLVVTGNNGDNPVARHIAKGAPRQHCSVPQTGHVSLPTL